MLIRQAELLEANWLLLDCVVVLLKDLFRNLEELSSFLDEGVDLLAAGVELPPVVLEDVLLFVVVQPVGHFVLDVLIDELALL